MRVFHISSGMEAMQKPFNFESFPDRRVTESLKWRVYAEEVLPMWVADMDFLSPPEVIEALRARVEHGVVLRRNCSNRHKTVFFR